MQTNDTSKPRCRPIERRAVNQNGFRLNQNGFSRYDHQDSNEGKPLLRAALLNGAEIPVRYSIEPHLSQEGRAKPSKRLILWIFLN